jgi:hypothetical protein
VTSAPRRKQTAEPSQRDRLLARPLPSLSYPILVVEPDEARAAVEAHRAARQALLRAEEGTPAYVAAEAGLAEAQAAADACYETVTLTALAPADYEALKSLHPPTATQVAAAEAEQLRPPDADPDTFVPALLAASAAGSDMTAEHWSTFLAEHCSDGERQELRVAVLGLNERARWADPMLPKGSITMRS